MKTAIYIQNGDTQLVLTPENEWEKNILKSMGDGQSTVRLYRGSFYENRTGYHRMGSQDDSLIVRLQAHTDQEDKP